MTREYVGPWTHSYQCRGKCGKYFKWVRKEHAVVDAYGKLRCPDCGTQLRLSSKMLETKRKYAVVKRI